MKTIKNKPGEEKGAMINHEPHEKSELKTDLPLSEKDEVKQAEERLRKAAKKQ